MVWHHVERLAGSLMLAGALWLAWISPDEAPAAFVAALTHPALWLNAGALAVAVLTAIGLWRAVRPVLLPRRAARRTTSRSGRLRA